MTTRPPSLGSNDWLQWVWGSPPVDKLKGRSRYFQTHQPWMEPLARHAPMQGRNEYVGLLGLDYLKNVGLVSRYKDHPFATTSDDLGWEIRPDAMAEKKVSGDVVIIEIKTARFLTSSKLLELNANRKGLEKFGLKYLVWTTEQPLQYSVRHNLINMRRAASEDISLKEMENLNELVSNKGQISVGHAIKNGFDLNCIFAACWKGYVFLPLTSSIDTHTQISFRPQEDYGAIFLDEKSIVDDWWDNLTNA